MRKDLPQVEASGPAGRQRLQVVQQGRSVHKSIILSLQDEAHTSTVVAKPGQQQQVLECLIERNVEEVPEKQVTVAVALSGHQRA